ncbi:hypothetical protein [Bacillus timonensis]|uniref:hypothetical protein n=1 Tax=Bacillus timonensis TaxID=1033734 RepID=UPI0012B51D25|nr:hypothetical protein [Bacillus timonensis]
MCNKEEKELGTTAIKRIDKSNVSGLSKSKKELLEKHMGSASANIDLNKIREWWKYENN